MFLGHWAEFIVADRLPLWPLVIAVVLMAKQK